MARPVTIFTGQWADLPFEEVCKKAKAWGYDGLEIACNGGSVVFAELQLEGKKRLAVQEFLAGCRIDPGTLLRSKDGERG